MFERKTDRHATVLAVVSLVILAYSLLIVQQILLGLLAIGSLFFVYLVWRLIRALERIASAHERVASALEADEQR